MKQNKKATTVTTMKEWKSKEASFIPNSVKKALVFLTQSYGWKVAQEKLHSVCSKIKKGNFKNQGLAWGIFIHNIWEKNKSEWFTIYMTRFYDMYFCRTTLSLRHFESDKNELVELYNKTTIVP